MGIPVLDQIGTYVPTFLLSVCIQDSAHILLLIRL